MRTTEHSAKPAVTPKIGRFALLRGLLHVSGTTAPKISRGSGAPSRRQALATLATLATALAALAFASAPALAARGHVFEKTVGRLGPGAGEFDNPHGIAVNEETGDVYVADTSNNRIDELTSSGAFVRAFGWGVLNGASEPQVCTTTCQAGIYGTAAGQLEAPYFIAIDNDPSSPSHGDFYVASSVGKQIQKFSPAGSEIGSPITEAPKGKPFGSILGIAVDPAGGLWVENQESFGIDFADSFDNAIANSFVSGKWRLVTSFPQAGFAFAAPDDLFTLEGFGASVSVSEFDYAVGTEYSYDPGVVFLEVIHRYLGGEGDATAVATDPSNGDVYVGFGGSVAHVTAEGQPVERFGEGHLTNAAGIAVDAAAKATAYVVDSGADALAIFAPEPPNSPIVSETFPKSVAAASATVQTSINPRSEPTEGPTSYRFEFGPCASLEACAGAPYTMSAPVPAGSVTPDFEVHNVTTVLEGLEPDTVYHSRVRVENKHGAVTGEEITFTTQSNSLESALPDNRAWEQVTPLHKQGGLIYWPVEGVFQAAADGNGFTYDSINAVAPGVEGSRASEETQNLALRSAGGVWESQTIAPRHDRGTGLKIGTALEYRAFSSDLSRAALEPPDQTPLSEYASERTPYVRENLTEPATYLPLVVGCPAAGEPCPAQIAEHANVPPGTEFGGGNLVGVPGEELNPLPLISYAASNPDMSDVLIDSPVALTEHGKSGLYEWSAGRLEPVGVLPDGEEVESGIAGEETGRRNVVSNDGSRVFWKTGGANAGLYMRDMASKGDMASKETVRLDEAQPGASGSGSSEPVFLGASADGSRAFFTDPQRLTSGAGAGGADLYVCEIITNKAGKLECALTDLTPETGGESAAVQGTLPGFAENGSIVYFVADGVLTGKEAGPSGEEARAGAPNLYVRHYDATSGEWAPAKLIAVLSPEDANAWGSDSDVAIRLSAESSPSGRYLAFMSERSLTGYDNRNLGLGKRDEEVYRYDAEAGGGQGELDCVSCNPTGAVPDGRQVGGSGSHSLTGAELHADPVEDWPHRWVAAIVPDARRDIGVGTSISQPRYVFDSGRVLFDVADSLVPADSNGNWDVYESEPTGTGSCTAASGSATVARSSGGCVALLSSGVATEGETMLDASASGNDVFFLTAQPLSVLDEDNELDIYDARVGGVAATPQTTTECLGEACQPAVEAPIDQTPGSLTFSGSGNLTPPPPAVVKKTVKCKKGDVKNKKHKCVRKKTKKAKKSSAKRAGNDLRTHR